MEQIRQAVERAKATGIVSAQQPDRITSTWPRQNSDPVPRRAEVAEARIQEIELNGTHLEARRIISHDVADPRAKSFDILRTQVLQSMDSHNWQFLAVTSPTPGCGKTVTAINLALSIARQPERSVLLVDMDLQKPQVARCLGVECDTGLLGVLEGDTGLGDAVFQARIGRHRFMVLPTEASISGSSEWMACSAMNRMLKDIKRDYRSRTVILDMPPMLSSDDVLAILPQMDCVLLVAGVGISTVSEIDECNRHLQSAEVVRLVLNKVPERSTKYC